MSRELNVGDVILSRTSFGVTKHLVHRVTPKFAFVKWNEIAEGKFPRIYDRNFSVLPRPKWPMNDYEVIFKETV